MTSEKTLEAPPAIDGSAGANKSSDLEQGHRNSDSTPEPAKNPNIVDWDGPADPANPRNWSRSWKLINIGLISASVLCCNLATTMFAPGATVMEHDFGFNNSTVEVLTITIASLGFVVGSLIVAPLSEVIGRIPIYRVSGFLYLGFTVGCAQSVNVGMFLAFRLLTGAAGACYMTTGGGTIADLLPKEERGTAMALFTVGPLLGPVIGPIVGGFVTQDLGWQWTFYLILILFASVYIPSFIFMRETSSVAILKAKATRLRKETGNSDLLAVGEKKVPFSKLLAQALIRPATFLIKSPILVILALYIAFVFGTSMLFFATFPLVYTNVYHWSIGISGLSYLGVGFGCAMGVVTFAKLSDRLLRSAEGEYKAERRLLLMMYLSPTVPIGTFIYGWTTEYGVHWIVPMIGTAIAGVGVVTITSSSQTYIIDIFGPLGAASALSAVTILRNIMGSFLPLASAGLYKNLGLGWGNSVLAFVATAFIAVPFALYWKGEKLRKRFPVVV